MSYLFDGPSTCESDGTTNTGKRPTDLAHLIVQNLSGPDQGLQRIHSHRDANAAIPPSDREWVEAFPSVCCHTAPGYLFDYP